MNLASELKELALLSHKERVQIAAKAFADKMHARAQALLGYGSFQNDDNRSYLSDLDKEIIQEVNFEELIKNQN